MTDPTPTPLTTPTPPQGLTEQTLREQWNAQADGFNQWDSLDPDEQFAWAQKCAIAAHEAARAQLPPNYIDPEHTGEDRELLEAFYLACQAEGGTADEMILRGIRAAIAADRAAIAADLADHLRDATEMALTVPSDVLEAARIELNPAGKNGSLVLGCLERLSRPTPTPEALQAAYAAWFKGEQGIPPSPAAARTAAAFASAVLRGDVQ